MISKKILIHRVEIEFDNGSPSFYYRLNDARKSKDLTEDDKDFLNAMEQKMNEKQK